MKRRSTKKLDNFLKELESAIADKDLKAKSISSVTIGWQIEHSLLVLNAVIDVLKSSNPQGFEKKFNFVKSYIFTVGRIPRGKGRAPESVKPKTDAPKEQLQSLADIARTNISDLSKLDTGKFFKHPIFGSLRLRDSVRFLELHTEHHLRIIRAIQKAHE